MTRAFLKPFDPFVQIIVLMLLSFASVAIFIVLANALINLIWGIDVYSNLEMLTDFNRPEVISINKFLLVFQHLGLFVIPPLMFSQFVSTKPYDFLNLVPVVKNEHWFFAIGTMFLALLPINAMVEINQAIQLPEALSGLEQMMQQAERQAELLTKAILGDTEITGLLLNIFIVAAIPAIGEELLFRGAIQKIITRWSGNIHAGIWISAFLFSAMHFQFYGFIPRMMLGALFGYMLILSGSIWLPILAHFINNATATVLHFFVVRGTLSEEAENLGSGNEQLLMSLISFGLLVGLMLLWRKSSRWPSIKEAYLSE
jgi:membrane protease YdiL (CAAX protease family)